MELPRGLVYNPEHSPLLVVSSNCSNGSSQQHNSSCDQDADNILSLMKSSGLIKDSMSSLITTTSADCTKNGLKKAIEMQMSKVIPSEESLFMFIYCGGGRDLYNFIKVSELGPSNQDFINVECDSAQPMHSLVLTDSNPSDLESCMTGKDVAKAMANSPAKPKQVLVILDCPFAAYIGEDIQKHLNFSCDLNLIVSQGKDHIPYYLSPLCNSTFSYFLYYFLSTPTQVFSVAGGMVKLRSLFDNVRTCCDALSSLIMVRDGDNLKTNRATPDGKFVQIIQSADAEMKRMEEKDDDDTDDVDAGGKFGKFLNRYYKKYLIKRVKLCDEAKDWVHAVMQGPLLQLKEKEVLAIGDKKVLYAAVGSMMFSIAKIQNALKRDSIAYSNIFIQVYIYVVAAINMVDQDIDVLDVELLKCAHEFYMRVLRDRNVEENEMKQLMVKIEHDSPSVF